MDAIKFLKERDRMCEMYKYCSNGCPFYKNYCCIIESKDKEQQVEIVEKWARENPIKTRQSEFLKLFPNADTNMYNKAINICPLCTDKTFSKDGHCPHLLKDCYDCKAEYWFGEVEE